MMISDYYTSIVQGNTILDVKAYFTAPRETTFFIKLNYDGGDDDGVVFELEMDVFTPSWRGRFSRMMSQLICSEPRRAELRAREETLYYHLDSTIRRLRLPDSQEYQLGVTFHVHFVQTSPQALKDFGLTTVFGLGSDSNNLLRGVRCEDEDEDEEGECSICCEEFRESTSRKELTRMPCSHTFHYSCLSAWLPKHETCPLCRYKLNWKTVDELPSPFE